MEEILNLNLLTIENDLKIFRISLWHWLDFYTIARQMSLARLVNQYGNNGSSLEIRFDSIEGKNSTI